MSLCVWASCLLFEDRTGVTFTSIAIANLIFQSGCAFISSVHDSSEIGAGTSDADNLEFAHA